MPRFLLGIAGVLALSAAALVSSPVARAGPGPGEIEVRFREAIRRVTPATVACVPWGIARTEAGFSSGVIVSPDGFVLSDGDVGRTWNREGGDEGRTWLPDVEVRVVQPSGGWRSYRARVVHRDREVDTALLRILRPPADGFPFVVLGGSDDLRVGDFAFVLGSAFDEDGRAPPTPTAGVISSFDPLPAGAAGGRHAYLYTSAAVNEGVNGGPLVDLDGRLAGTVSTWVDPGPEAVHQFLGKGVPVDRLRSVYQGVAAAPDLFDSPPPGAHRPHALETVFQAAGMRARSAIVSLQVERRRPVSGLSPLEESDTTIPRWEGPVSGVLISADGWIVTSLYNLTNVATLAEPLWRAPPGARVEEGLADVRGVTACFADGGKAPAHLVGYDRRLGVALLRADLPHPLPGGDALAMPRLLEPAPPAALEAGRFVLAVGNPFGAQPRPHPLLTVGILSRHHPSDAASAWRGQWQTDAAGLDTNCGGGAVDIEGRLLGLFTLWYPARHGRNSGVAFVVPWERIEAALPDLKAGRGPEPALLGVRFASGFAPRIAAVIEASAAARAGLRPGDVFHRVDREDTPSADDVRAVIGYRCRGDVVDVTVERDGALHAVRVRLGGDPGGGAPARVDRPREED